MNLAQLIRTTLTISIGLSMFGLGLVTRREAVLYLWRHPLKLAWSLAAMYLVMPLLALSLVVSFGLHPSLEVALVALAVSPVSPLVPGKELKAGGRDAYAISLLAATAVLAIVAVPAAMQLMGRSFGASPQISSEAIAKVVSMTVLAPLAGGLLVRRLARGFAERIAHPLHIVAGVLLVLGALPLLIRVFPAFLTLTGNGTLLAIVGSVIAALSIGHLFGGPAPRDQTVLAMSTACRHPAVAITVAAATAPEQKLAAAAILLYLVLSSVGAGLYARWVTRRQVVRSKETPLFPSR